MTISVECPSCHKSKKVAEKHIGKRFKCECGQIVRVDQPVSAQAAPDPFDIELPDALPPVQSEVPVSANVPQPSVPENADVSKQSSDKWPPVAPKRHPQLGGIRGSCHDRAENQPKVLMIAIGCLVLGIAMIVAGAILWNVPGAIVAGLGGLAVLAGIGIGAEMLFNPLTMKVAYDKGFCVIKKGGAETSYDWSEISDLHVQECYNSRFSKMHLIFKVNTTAGKTVEFRTLDAGLPKVVAETIKNHVPHTYETWDEVLARTGG